MRLSAEVLSEIFDKTDGHCYYCGKQLAWKNYGKVGKRGAWEVDHSRAKSKGGSDYVRNLVPACVEDNRDKSNKTRGSNYKQKFEPATLGGYLNDLLGFEPGSFGASRRRVRK